MPYLTKRIDTYNTLNAGKAGVFLPNLIGFMIGNGVTNWKYDTFVAFTETAYWFGLGSQENYDDMK